METGKGSSSETGKGSRKSNGKGRRETSDRCTSSTASASATASVFVSPSPSAPPLSATTPPPLPCMRANCGPAWLAGRSMRYMAGHRARSRALCAPTVTEHDSTEHDPTAHDPTEHDSETCSVQTQETHETHATAHNTQVAQHAQPPEPTLSPTDPVPRGLLTLCRGASSGAQGLGAHGSSHGLTARGGCPCRRSWPACSGAATHTLLAPCMALCMEKQWSRRPTQPDAQPSQTPNEPALLQPTLLQPSACTRPLSQGKSCGASRQELLLGSRAPSLSLCPCYTPGSTIFKTRPRPHGRKMHGPRPGFCILVSAFCPHHPLLTEAVREGAGGCGT
jgi:hypothetical protein